MAIAMAGLGGLSHFAQALPGDYVWQKAGTQGITGDQADWSSITSSADGTKLAAVVSGGSIYTSTDSGATWTEQTAAGSRDWISITASADGTKLAAVVGVGSIYTSTDSGATWTEQTAAGSRYWYSITSSADGTKLAAVAYGGSIYTSTNSGTTWTQQTAAGSRYWTSITSSADGTKLAAVVDGGYIYTSTNSGATWTEQTAAGSRYWISITASADGTKLAAAVAYGGSIYTSTDSGSTWTEQTAAGSREWQSIASSADGTRLAVGVYGGPIYLATTEGPAAITQPLATIPDGNRAPAGIKSAVANSILGITSSTCYSLNTPSVRTLGSSTVTAPSGIDILGGVAFTISCVSNGGSSSVRVALAEQLADISSLRIYKALSDGSNLTDITNQVSISNQDNKTVINYNLIDGGELDEDGLANGTIVDPLYIGVSAESADGDTTGSNGALADTGQGTFALLAGASLLIISGLAVLLGRKKLLRQ